MSATIRHLIRRGLELEAAEKNAPRHKARRYD
jgi:hypothetical protein